MQISIAQKFIDEVSARPLEFFAGACIFFAVIFGASVHSVVSTVLALLFITSLVYVGKWREAWNALSKYERWVLTGFILCTLSGVISYLHVTDTYEYVKQSGRYLRFALIVPVYLLFVKCDLRLYKYFIAGVVISGPVFLITAILCVQDMSEVFGFRQIGASGQYYQILFGNIAMLNALFMAVYVLDKKISRMAKIVITLSMICALYASFLSVARSGWIAFVVSIILLTVYLIRKKRLNLKAIVIAMVVLSAAVAVFPEKEVISDRISRAVDNVTLFASGEKHKSSSGTRLAFWDVAINIWKEHPIIGTGLGDFDEEFEASQLNGLYPKVPVHSNAHSLYFHSLATTGSIGFIVMIFALFVFPFRLFLEKMREGYETVGLSGMVFVLSFAVFGLTETWTLRAPFMSMYLICIVALMSSSPRPGSQMRMDKKLH